MSNQTFTPKDPDYVARVQEVFANQQFMTLLGVEVGDISPGEVELILPYRKDITQQHEFVHAAAITAIADSACGGAALTLMEPGSEVLAVEFKVNLLSPAAGERFIARAKVIRPGKIITVCSAEVHAEQGESRKLVAAMQATMIAPPNLRTEPTN